MATKKSPAKTLVIRERNPAAVALGRLGGAAGKNKRSAAVTAAAIANGKKGGRPTTEERQKRLAEIQATEPCPACDAATGARCKEGRKELDVPHRERVDAYNWRIKQLKMKQLKNKTA
jgi:hypothetical protein